MCATPAHASGCLSDEQITTKMMPPDFYKATAACLNENNYEQAIVLFAFSTSYLGYDMERIIDPKAETRSSDLTTEAMISVNEERAQTFRTKFAKSLRDPVKIAKTCARVMKVGAPSYEIPTYLIANQDNPAAEMMPILNHKGTWMRILERKLRCGITKP